MTKTSQEKYQYQSATSAIPFDYEVEAGEGLQRTATVRLEEQSILAQIDKKIVEYKNQVKLPGFRPGKVPPNVIRQKYGESLKAEVLENSLREVYPEVLEKEADVAGIVSIDMKNGPEAKDGAFEMLVIYEVDPTFDLVEPKKLTIKAPATEVTDQEVEETINGLRLERASYDKKEGVVEDGDYVNLEYSSKVLTEDEESGDLSEAQSSRICIGKAQLHADIDAELLGKEEGVEFEIAVEHAADATSANAGKKMLYAIQVGEIQTQTLPELDDEFAKSFQGVESFEDMKAKIRESIAHERSHAAEAAINKGLLEKLREANPLELPQSFVQSVQRQKADQLLQQFQQQGMLQEGKEGDQTRYFAYQAVRGAAEIAAHDTYLLKQLAANNKIEVSEQDLEHKLEHLAGHYGMDLANVKKELGEAGIESVTEELRNEKALKSVEDKATIERLVWSDWQAYEAEQKAAEQMAAMQQSETESVPDSTKE